MRFNFITWIQCISLLIPFTFNFNVQVYASLSPVVHIVNIESAATESLANVTVCVPRAMLVVDFFFLVSYIYMLSFSVG
jgi:hypothetical protein